MDPHHRTTSNPELSGFVRSPWLALAASVLVFAGLCLFLVWEPSRQTSEGGEPLVLYCAAGVRSPVEAIIAAYRKERGVEVRADYGGSGQLLATLRVEKERPRADLFLAADESYVAEAQRLGLAAESLKIARWHPVIAVRRGNPLGLRSVDDLQREGLKLALANPETAAIGKVVRGLLDGAGKWRSLEERSHGLRAAAVFVGTVTEVANNLKLGTADAGIVWDATVRQYPELEAVEDELLKRGAEDIVISVTAAARRPAEALRFARYVAASDRGILEFQRLGWEPAPGDIWEERPEIVLYSGGINRPAIEKTVAEFEEREGVRITVKYAGCGILVADMRAIGNGATPGSFPDAYFACDTSFLPPVAERFLEPVPVSQTDIVLLVARGNPRGIRGLDDLARPGVRIAMANEEHSALGALTRQLLERRGLYEAARKNVTFQAPSADGLVLRMLAGGGSTSASAEDVAVVYEANCVRARETMDVVRLDAAAVPDATAVQPFSIARDSRHQRLTERLRAALLSAASRQRFEAAGFRWRTRAE